MSSAGAPTQYLPPNTDRWQYQVVQMSIGALFGPAINLDQMQNILNQLGADGWELVNTVDINVGQAGTRELIFIFKRQIGQRP